MLSTTNSENKTSLSNASPLPVRVSREEWGSVRCSKWVGSSNGNGTCDMGGQPHSFVCRVFTRGEC